MILLHFRNFNQVSGIQEVTDNAIAHCFVR